MNGNRIYQGTNGIYESIGNVHPVAGFRVTGRATSGGSGSMAYNLHAPSGVRTLAASVWFLHALTRRACLVRRPSMPAAWAPTAPPMRTP